jgi:hypothetical protein
MQLLDALLTLYPILYGSSTLGAVLVYRHDRDRELRGNRTN